MRTRGSPENADADSGPLAGLKDGEYDVMLSGDALVLRETAGGPRKDMLREIKQVQKSRDRERKKDRARRRDA